MKKNLRNGSFVLTKLPRMLIMMKTVLILLVCSLNLQAAVYSQQKKFDISMKKASLADVFQYLRQVSEYKFVYDSDAVKQFQPVSVDLKGVGLEEVLEDCLKGSPFVFLIEDDLVIIREQKSVPQKQTQEVKIVGKVTDEKGSLLPGVTVQIQGTSLGTVTDTDGKYVLSVPEMKELTLVYSFIGMEKKAVRWKGEKELNITLVTEVAEMDEVVVTGIFTRKKESFTGSSATFTNKELKMIGNSNVLESLKTLDPSFAIIENNDFGSDPNHLPNIEIRGKTSVIGLTEEYNTDPNQPLFILDGFESTLATISDLSMDRVQSITVLKDAAATAIYGSKAANGVVVVETKAPEAGQLRLNYTGNLNFTFADLSDYNLMNAEEKLQFELLSGLYQSWGPDGYLGSVEQERKYNMRLQEVRRGVDTYWMNEPLRFATTHKHNLFLEGGDGVMRYGVGVSYGKTQGVMKGSDRDVLNGNVRLIYRKGRVAFTNSLNVDYTRAERESVSFKRFAQTNPYYRKTDENGEPVKVLESFSYFDINTFRTINENVYGPFYDLSNTNFDRTHTLGITNNFEADWRVIDELRIRARIGVNKSNEQAEKFSSPFNSEFVGKEDNEKGAYTESEKHVFGYDGDLSVTYGKLLAERHMVNAVAGMRFTQSTSNLNGYTMRGFIDDEFSNPSFAQEYNPDKKVYQDVKKRTASYYVNLGYAYDNRYLLDANWRADGASIFGVNKLFTNTWSVGLGWNIHNEHFLEGAGWLDMLKLRASVGNPGNQNFDAYIAMKIYTYNNHHTNPWGVSAIINNFGNPDREWQKTRDRNIGLDLVVFNNRLRMNFDYFSKKTDPLLVYTGVPSSTGGTSVPANVGGQVTKGYTVVLNYALLKKEHLLWQVNATLRHLTSEYRNVSAYLSRFSDENKTKNMLRYYDGGSPSDLWAVRSAGIDAATGREIFLHKDGTQSFAYNVEDEVVVGNSDPKLEGVVGMSFYYKGFSASANFRYRLGGQIFMETLYNKVENISFSDVHYNQDKRALYDRWKEPGDNAKFRAISTTADTPMSSRFVADNNVFSGESISVGYESQGKWLKSVGASSLTVRAYMNDIFRISTVKNERGIDYPFARSVSMSLGLRF